MPLLDDFSGGTLRQASCYLQAIDRDGVVVQEFQLSDFIVLVERADQVFFRDEQSAGRIYAHSLPLTLDDGGTITTGTTIQDVAGWLRDIRNNCVISGTGGGGGTMDYISDVTFNAGTSELTFTGVGSAFAGAVDLSALDTNFANTDLTFTEGRQHILDSNQLLMLGATTTADGSIFQQGTQSIVLAGGIATSSGRIELTGAGINLRFAGTADLQLDSDPGTAGQVLRSSGPNAAPTWVDLPPGTTDTHIGNSDFSITENRSVSMNSNALFINGNANPGNGSSIIVNANDVTVAGFGPNSGSFIANADGLELDFRGAGDLELDGDAGTSGQVLTSNGPGAAPTWEDAGGGVSTFIALTDTPNSFGTTGQILQVNAGGTALEWTTPGSGADGVVTNVVLNGSTLEFTGTAPGFDGDIDLSSIVENFANTNLTLDANRTHDLNGFQVEINDGGNSPRFRIDPVADNILMWSSANTNIDLQSDNIGLGTNGHIQFNSSDNHYRFGPGNGNNLPTAEDTLDQVVLMMDANGRIYGRNLSTCDNINYTSTIGINSVSGVTITPAPTGDWPNRMTVQDLSGAQTQIAGLDSAVNFAAGQHYVQLRLEKLGGQATVHPVFRVVNGPVSNNYAAIDLFTGEVNPGDQPRAMQGLTVTDAGDHWRVEFNFESTGSTAQEVRIYPAGVTSAQFNNVPVNPDATLTNLITILDDADYTGDVDPFIMADIPTYSGPDSTCGTVRPAGAGEEDFLYRGDGAWVNPADIGLAGDVVLQTVSGGNFESNVALAVCTSATANTHILGPASNKLEGTSIRIKRQGVGNVIIQASVGDSIDQGANPSAPGNAYDFDADGAVQFSARTFISNGVNGWYIV